MVLVTGRIVSMRDGNILIHQRGVVSLVMNRETRCGLRVVPTNAYGVGATVIPPFPADNDYQIREPGKANSGKLIGWARTREEGIKKGIIYLSNP